MRKIGHERVPLTQISLRNKIIKESKPHHARLSYAVQTQRPDYLFVIVTQRSNQLIVLVYQQCQLHPRFIWIYYFLPCQCQKKNATMKLNLSFQPTSTWTYVTSKKLELYLKKGVNCNKRLDSTTSTEGSFQSLSWWGHILDCLSTHGNMWGGEDLLERLVHVILEQLYWQWGKRPVCGKKNPPWIGKSAPTYWPCSIEPHHLEVCFEYNEGSKKDDFGSWGVSQGEDHGQGYWRVWSCIWQEHGWSNWVQPLSDG